MIDSIRYFVVANPSSGGGKPLKNLNKIQALFEKKGALCECHISNNSRHFDDLVAWGLELGFRHIICVGGDGTIHAAVNVVMQQPETIRAEVSLGLISLGTGNDWIKTYRQQDNLEDKINHILEGKTTLQDIGVLTIREEKIYFLNIAGVGFNGFIVPRISPLKKLGAIGYKLGLLYWMFGYKNKKITIRLNNKSFTLRSFMTSIGICKFAGGGMMLCPKADPSDGLFHITVIKDLSVFQIIKYMPLLKTGKFDHLDIVETYTSSSLEIELDDANEILECEADGEYCGIGNVTATLIPKAIRFIV